MTEETAKHRKQSYWRLVGRQFRRKKLSVLSLCLLFLLLVIALMAPFLAGGKPLYLLKDGERYIFPNVIKYADLVNFDYEYWEPGPEDRAYWPPVPYAPDRSSLRRRLEAPSRDHWLGTNDQGRNVLSRMI